MRPRLSASRPALSRASPVGGALAPGGVEQRVRRDLLARRQVRDHPAVVAFDGGHLLVEAEGDVALAQQVLERDRDLAVDEGEEPVASVDQRDPGAHRGEHRRVLHADDPCAHHGHRARHVVLQPQDAVGVDHPAARRSPRRGVARAACPTAITMFSALTIVSLTSPVASWILTRVLVLEGGVADQEPHAVAAKLLAHHGRLVGDDARGAVAQDTAPRRLRGGRGAADRVCRRRGPRCPRGSPGAGSSTGTVPVWIETPPTRSRRSTTPDPLAQLRRLDGRALPAGPRADDEEIEVHRARGHSIVHERLRAAIAQFSAVAKATQST